MTSLREISQRVDVRQPEALVVNANTRVKLLRRDVDENFSIAQLEKRGMGDRLKAFAKRQIETCPAEMIGGEKGRRRFLKRLGESHPIDIVPHLITIEPYLMLSNLTQNQLKDLIPELRDSVTEANRTSVAGALSSIQGVFIGRTSSGQD